MRAALHYTRDREDNDVGCAGVCNASWVCLVAEAVCVIASSRLVGRDDGSQMSVKSCGSHAIQVPGDPSAIPANSHARTDGSLGVPQLRSSHHKIGG